MQFLLRGLMLGTLVACTTPTAAPQPLDGVWNLQATFAGFVPRTMTLRQRGSTIRGTGSAMGVDRVIPIAISGSYSDDVLSSAPLVALTFRLADNDQLTAQFNGALQGPDRIDGSVTYYGIDLPPTDSLVFTRAR